MIHFAGSLALAFVVASAVASLVALPSHAQQRPGPPLVRELAIDDAAVPNGLTAVTRVLIGPKGAVYVEQRRDNVILMFDSEGRYVRNIGRKGQGPGETEGLAMSGFLGDTLWTFDWRTSKFSLFSATGAFLEAFRPPAIAVPIPARPVSLSAGTLLSGGKVLYNTISMPSRMTPDRMPAVPNVIATRQGAVVDTLVMLMSLDRASFGVENAGGGGAFFGDVSLGVLLNTNPLTGVAADGEWIVVADQSQCASRPRHPVVRLSPSRDTLWRASLECPRLAVPRGFVDSVVAKNVDYAVTRLKAAPAHAESQIRGKIGEVKAFGAIRSMQVGHDGSIWIRPMKLKEDSEEWIRADPRPGAPDRLVLPPRTQLMLVVDATHIWVTETDEDGLQTLVRYRVQGWRDG